MPTLCDENNNEMAYFGGLTLVAVLGVFISDALGLSPYGLPIMVSLLTVYMILLDRHFGPSPLDRVAERPSQSVENIFAAHYRDRGYSEERFHEVWNKIGENLAVDPGKLLPSDRFDHELSARTPVRFLDAEMFELVEWYERETKRLGLERPEGSFESIDDLVTWFLAAHTLEVGKSREQ